MGLRLLPKDFHAWLWIPWRGIDTIFSSWSVRDIFISSRGKVHRFLTLPQVAQDWWCRHLMLSFHCLHWTFISAIKAIMLATMFGSTDRSVIQPEQTPWLPKVKCGSPNYKRSIRIMDTWWTYTPLSTEWPLAACHAGAVGWPLTTFRPTTGRWSFAAIGSPLPPATEVPATWEYEGSSVCPFLTSWGALLFGECLSHSSCREMTLKIVKFPTNRAKCLIKKMTKGPWSSDLYDWQIKGLANERNSSNVQVSTYPIYCLRENYFTYLKGESRFSIYSDELPIGPNNVVTALQQCR